MSAIRPKRVIRHKVPRYSARGKGEDGDEDYSGEDEDLDGNVSQLGTGKKKPKKKVISILKNKKKNNEEEEQKAKLEEELKKKEEQEL